MVMARVVLLLASFIVLSSIERVNVGFAAIRINADIGLDPKSYGVGIGLFFAGYLLFQLPSAAVLRRLGARRWIAGSVIGWGCVAAAMALIESPAHFYTLRFLLGVFESGFAPGVVWYVSQWLPQHYRARAIGLTLLAIPTSVIVGGPLCGALLSIDAGAIEAWWLMFAVEGIATVIAGIAALFWFADRPADAPWLAVSDRERLEATLEDERQPATGDLRLRPLAEVLRDPFLWLCAGLWFVLITGANAIIFWLPIATINLFGNASGAVAPVVIGWVVATTGSVVVPVYWLAALLLAGTLLVPPMRRIAEGRLRR